MKYGERKYKVKCIGKSHLTNNLVRGFW